jgi:hypothetical protein
VVPGVLVIVGSVGSYYNLHDYLSVVFDEAPQTQLPLSIASTSDITATIFKEGEPEEDPDKMFTSADLCRDEAIDFVITSPALRKSIRIPMVFKNWLIFSLVSSAASYLQ